MSSSSSSSPADSSRLSQFAAYVVEHPPRRAGRVGGKQPFSVTHLRAMCAFVLDKLSLVPPEQAEERRKLNPNRSYVWQLAKQEGFLAKYLDRPARLWKMLGAIFRLKVTPRLNEFVDDPTDLAMLQEICELPSKREKTKSSSRGEIVIPRTVENKRLVKPVVRFEIPVKPKLTFRHAYSSLADTADPPHTKLLHCLYNNGVKRKSRDYTDVLNQSANKKSRDFADDQSELDRIDQLKQRLNALTEERDALKAKNVKLRLQVDTPFRIAQIPLIPLVDYIDLVLPLRHAPSSSTNHKKAAASGSRDDGLICGNSLVSCYVQTGEPIENLNRSHVTDDDDQSEHEFLSREETLALVKERIDFFENQLKLINSESAIFQQREPVTIDLESLDASNNEQRQHVKGSDNDIFDDKRSTNDILNDIRSNDDDDIFFDKFRASSNDLIVEQRMNEQRECSESSSDSDNSGVVSPSDPDCRGVFRATFNENDYETISSPDDDHHSRQYNIYDDGSMESV